MNHLYRLLAIVFLGLIAFESYAQTSIHNGSGTDPDGSAMLDVQSSNSGMLIPRVALTGTADGTTIATPATSLLVYNTATAGGLTPGYHYNSGSSGSPNWTRLMSGNTTPLSGAGVANQVTYWSGPNTLTSTGNFTYGTTGNLSVLNAESTGGEVRLGAAWNRPGVYSSNGLHLFSGSTQPLYFGNDNVEYMRLTGAGNLAIGNTAGTQKLDVTGNIKGHHLVQGPLIARPMVTWSAGGTSTGAIIIKLPGNTANYGMLHMQIDVYEYGSTGATSYILGGHNWNGQWYNYSCQTIGTATKKVRLAVKDGQYAVVLGETGSSWSYGHVVLSKITNGGYYTDIINLAGNYSIAQDNSAESYTWISGDLNNNVLSVSNATTLFPNITGDNLGNHTATSNLLMSGHAVTGFGRLEPAGVGGNSGQGNHSYAIFQEAGAWTHPYPDLRIAFHTGIKLGANSGYNGIRFYNDADMATQTMSVGDGDNNVRINYALYSPIVYDLNDAGYFLDANSTSELYKFSRNTLSRNSINSLQEYSPWVTRAANSPEAGYTYRNGAMGWGQVDLNTIFSNWGGGIIDSWSNPANAPGGSSHYVGFQGMHANHQNGSQAYGFQMVTAGESPNRFFWRNAWPNLNPWVEMIHTGNIGSYGDNLGNHTATTTLNMNGSAITNSANMYTSGWFRNTSANNGLYNEALGAHFYATAANVWNMGGGGTYPQLVFRDNHQSTIRGHVYSDVNGFGLLDNTSNWNYRSWAGGQELYGTTYAGWGGLHANIMYDRDNTGYYMDPHATSELNQISVATRARWGKSRTWTNRTAYNGDSNYWTGSNGWGTERTWASAWSYGSGGVDIWGSGTDHPQGAGYIHAQGILSGQHYASSDGGSAYGWMMVGANNATENRYWLRGKWGGSTSGWVEMITTGNVGSYGDNLGNHTATTNLNMNSQNINTVGDIFATQNYGKGLVGVYSDVRYQNVFAMGAAYRLAADGTSPGNLYGLAWTHSNIGGQSRPGLGHQLLAMSNGGTTAAMGNGFWTQYGIETGSSGTYNRFHTWTDLPNIAGLYSSNHNGAHFFPNNGSYGAWKMQGNRNGWGGIEFGDPAGNGELTLMMNHSSYGWGSQQTGVHNNSYGWLWYFSHQRLYASGLTDINDGNYYVDPNGYSVINTFRVAGGSPAPGKVLTSSDGAGNVTWEYPSNPWENMGTNVHLICAGGAAATDYEWGVTYNNSSPILRVTCNSWNTGQRVCTYPPYPTGDTEPFTWGGACWIWGTASTWDDGCSGYGTAYHSYYQQDGNGRYNMVNGNGCGSLPTVYRRRL
jgi:hypothetical protein